VGCKKDQCEVRTLYRGFRFCFRKFGLEGAQQIPESRLYNLLE
jgi:hypothetical protein